MRADERRAMDPQTLGTGVHDPRAFRRFSEERATVVPVYSDQDLSLVVWNLERGQENGAHQHPGNAHALIILEGRGDYLKEDGPPSPSGPANASSSHGGAFTASVTLETSVSPTSPLQALERPAMCATWWASPRHQEGEFSAIGGSSRSSATWKMLRISLEVAQPRTHPIALLTCTSPPSKEKESAESIHVNSGGG